jgi:NADPH-dependent curcumin reductase CurA
MKESRKIVIKRLGESFRDCTKIVTEQLPSPRPGEVMVRHHIVGVNGIYDQMMCLDRIEHSKVIPPAGTGVEAIGEIEMLGEGVQDFAVGDPVAVVRAGHGYRLRQNCAVADLIPVPEASKRVLALIPSGVSALVALEQVGEMKTGELVCITAAAGGLGNIAVQLAVTSGNRVLAVCGNEQKANWLKSVGVERAINYRKEDLSQILDQEYQDQLDLVLDTVGGKTFDSLLRNMAPHGRLVSCGYTSDRLPTEAITSERIYTSLYWKAASVRGFMNYRFAHHAADARRRLWKMVESGQLEPLIDQNCFKSLEQVPDAVDHLIAAKNLGKVLVDLRD